MEKVKLIVNDAGMFGLKLDDMAKYKQRDARRKYVVIKLMKGKALMKHSLHEETATSVLMQLFTSGNERCRTTDAPPIAHERDSICICKQQTLNDS